MNTITPSQAASYQMITMAHLDLEQDTQKSLFDADLYCEEEKWPQIEDDEITTPDLSSSVFPLMADQDLFYDDEELHSLFSKEKEACFEEPRFCDAARKEAVDWILKINALYGFSALTAILAVNYLDRFLTTLNSQKDHGHNNNKQQQPWMMQLSAVTCLSLAAKVEETYVPLLLDLQVEGTKYVFEAKTIQRMELLVLSSLQWRMNPVTPLSFLDHIIRRLIGYLKSYVHLDFLNKCEILLLSVISDWRLMGYLPSVLATAIMLHVIHQVEPCNAIDYENQLISVLKINKEEVDDCYELISETLVSKGTTDGLNNGNYINPPLDLKRKYSEYDELYNNNSSSNDSWGVESCISSSSNDDDKSNRKKSRVQEQQMKLHPSFTRSVFLNALN